MVITKTYCQSIIKFNMPKSRSINDHEFRRCGVTAVGRADEYIIYSCRQSVSRGIQTVPGEEASFGASLKYDRPCGVGYFHERAFHQSADMDGAGIVGPDGIGIDGDVRIVVAWRRGVGFVCA